MSWKDVQKALNLELESYCNTNNIPLVYQNTTASQTSPYIAYNFIPSVTQSTAMGLNACDRYSGIYQIDIFCTWNDDPTEAEDIEQDLIDVFFKGANFTSNGQTVKVLNRTPRTPFKDAEFYHRIVDVSYYGDSK